MSPAFEPPLPFTRPLLPELSQVLRHLEAGWHEGRLTKGPVVEAYEQAAARHLGVNHTVAVSSCTIGLTLAIQALKLEGDCLVPSFTFSATVQALLWNRIRPVFVDCNPNRFTADLSCLESAVTKNTSAVLVPYVFGNPPPLQELENFCGKHKLALILDAAHAFGTMYHGEPVGPQGTLQVFSTSATKLLCTGEGGMIATKDSRIAEALSLLREYGQKPDGEVREQGLNGRLTEFQGAMGLAGLTLLEEHARRRNRIAKMYREALHDLPLSFQEMEPDCRSSYKDFAVLLREEWSLSRDETAGLLDKEGIPTKRYFSPPLHAQEFFRQYSLSGALPHTDEISSRILCLPISFELKEEQIDKIADVFRKIFQTQKTPTGRKESL